MKAVCTLKTSDLFIEKSVYTTHSFEIEEDLGLAIEDDIEVFDSFSYNSCIT